MKDRRVGHVWDKAAAGLKFRGRPGLFYRKRGPGLRPPAQVERLKGYAISQVKTKAYLYSSRAVAERTDNFTAPTLR
jgi:hypothetical protein